MSASVVEVATKLPQLLEPFPTNEIKWKPQSVKGDKCMAVAYIDARLVQDRLDEVVGQAYWKDYYEILPDGHTVQCSLAIRIDGEWIVKQDVGSPSEQPDAGDRMKASYSDALKRAAVKWGVGRYLYSLPFQWVDYNAQMKQITVPPRLPDWAIPEAEKKQGKQQELKASMSAANLDTSKPINENQLSKLAEMIASTKTELPKMLVHFKVENLEAMTQAQFHEAIGLLKRRLDQMQVTKA